MNTLQKLNEIHKKKCIYNIHYCNAGVGFQFYEEKLITGEALEPDWWKKGLVTYKYYPTFAKAVAAEYKRLK